MISPGCGLRSSPPLVVVVDDFDMCRFSFIPNKANPPLVIDPDRILSFPVCLQRFQPVARRNTQISKHPRLIQQTELSQGHVLNVGGQSSAPPDQIDSVSRSAKLWIIYPL